jgi:hypothetical protein
LVGCLTSCLTDWLKACLIDWLFDYVSD